MYAYVYHETKQRVAFFVISCVNKYWTDMDRHKYKNNIFVISSFITCKL